jgi:hypothetical protein
LSGFAIWNIEGALAAAQEAVEIRRAWPPLIEGFRPDLAVSLYNLGSCLSALGIGDSADSSQAQLRLYPGFSYKASSVYADDVHDGEGLFMYFGRVWTR